MGKIGDRIKKCRKARRMTQTELAEMTGYNCKGAICKIEKGKCDVNSEKLELFAKALNVSKSYLVGDQTDKPANGIIDELVGKIKDRIAQHEADLENAKGEVLVVARSHCILEDKAIIKMIEEMENGK